METFEEDKGEDESPEMRRHLYWADELRSAVEMKIAKRAPEGYVSEGMLQAKLHDVEMRLEYLLLNKPRLEDFE